MNSNITFEYTSLVQFLTVSSNFYIKPLLLNCPLFSAEIDEYYADVKYERIAILNALGAFHTFLGKAERAPQKEAHFKDATQYYNRASRIDETEPSTWIGKGYTTTEHFRALRYVVVYSLVTVRASLSSLVMVA